MKLSEWADKITRFWRKDEANLEQEKYGSSVSSDLATRIAQWDGRSVKDLPIIDPYDHDVKQYDTPKLQDTVPEKYRGLIHEAARPDDSISFEGATSTDSVRILAIDQAGEALVYKRVESNELEGMTDESIEHMSAAQAYEMIDNYRASHDLDIAKELDDDYMPQSPSEVKLEEDLERIKNWDGVSLNNLPVLDPQDCLVGHYHTENILKEIPADYQGTIKEAIRAISRWSSEDKSQTTLEILAVDKQGEALVCINHQSWEFDVDGPSVVRIPAQEAYAMADNFRASHEIVAKYLGSNEFLPPNFDYQDIDGSLKEKIALLQELRTSPEGELTYQRAEPGQTYSGPIVETHIGSELGMLVMQETEPNRLIVHKANSLAGEPGMLKIGQDVVIRYPHGNIGLVASAEKMHAMTNERQFGIEHQSASMER